MIENKVSKSICHMLQQQTVGPVISPTCLMIPLQVAPVKTYSHSLAEQSLDPTLPLFFPSESLDACHRSRSVASILSLAFT